MREPMEDRTRVTVDVVLVFAGIIGVFIVDLLVDIPLGVASGYALFILIAMLAERTRLIVIAAGLALLGLLLASFTDPSNATLPLDTLDFTFNRVMQACGIVLVGVLAVLGVRRRERLASAKKELASSVEELEGATEQLREEQDRLIALAESMPVPVWLSGSRGTITYVSRGALEYLGKDMQDSDEWLDVIHPDDRDRAESVIWPALASGDTYEVELRLRRRDGEYRAHLIRAVPIGSAVPARLGRSTQWWSTATDIEDLRRSEHQAAELASRLQDTLESITDGVIAFTEDLHYAYLNSAAGRMFERDPEALVGKLVWEVYPQSANTEFARAIEAVRDSGQPVTFTQDGTTIERSFEFTVSKSSFGFITYAKDITEIRALDQRLERANRLESVGGLTGGIAHDFNNLLTVISGGAEALADSDLTEHDEAMRAMIAEAASRGAGLIAALLAFARRQSLSPEPTSVAETVAALSPLLERTLGGAIKVTYAIDADLPPVMVDRSKLDNSLLNLVINARDAMPDGGVVTISAERYRHDADSAALVELPAGDYVQISVVDTGSGISEEALPRLFEPFFTTKPMGSGSGMGLAMAWGFATQSGGTLHATSEVGEGSVFSFFLPITDVVEPVQEDAETTLLTTGSGTVLLVEDDELVRAYTARRLDTLGYRVVEAADGRSALSELRSRDDIDLLLTDIVMPGGMSGTELAREARALDPTLPVLCVSGYTEQVLAADGRLDPEAELLTKPYSIHDLADRVSHLVSRRRRATHE